MSIPFCIYSQEPDDGSPAISGTTSGGLGSGKGATRGSLGLSPVNPLYAPCGDPVEALYACPLLCRFRHFLVLLFTRDVGVFNGFQLNLKKV
jgi:hypothetical protein